MCFFGLTSIRGRGCQYDGKTVAKYMKILRKVKDMPKAVFGNTTTQPQDIDGSTSPPP